MVAAEADVRLNNEWYIYKGIPIAFLAIGICLAIAGGEFFWPGTGLAYAGAAWLFWWYFSKELDNNKKLAGLVRTFIATVMISWMAFKPAPIGIMSTIEEVNYAEAKSALGIKWRDICTELKTVISNQSSEYIEELEIFIKTDRVISDLGLDRPRQCTYEKIADNTFRIFCDRLYVHETLEIVSATIPDTGTVRIKPSWVSITANYLAFGRPEQRHFSKCFTASCPPIAASLQFGTALEQK